MVAVDKVDAVLKNLQHVTALAKGELRSQSKGYRALKDKHDHLAVWAEAETMRKSGLKEVSEERRAKRARERVGRYERTDAQSV